MKKNILVILLLHLAMTSAISQSIVEDSKGKSSIVLPAGNIIFNTSDAQLGVAYYYGLPNYINFNDSSVYNKRLDPALLSPNRLFFGGRAVGKADNGIGSILSEGKLVPGSEFQGIIGFRGFLKPGIINNLKIIKTSQDSLDSIDKKIIAKLDQNKRDIENAMKFCDGIKENIKDTCTYLLLSKTHTDSSKAKVYGQDTILYNQMKNIIKRSQVYHLNLDSNQIYLLKRRDSLQLININHELNKRDSIICRLTQSNNQQTIASLNTIIKSGNDQLVFLTQNHERRQLDSLRRIWIIIQISAVMDSILSFSVYDSQKEKIFNELIKSKDSISNIKCKPSYKLYIAIESDARQFKLFDPTASTNSAMYNSVKYRGYNLRIGFNTTLTKNLMAGISIGYQRKDNFDDLKELKIESETKYIDSNRTDTAKETIGNLYKGEYIKSIYTYPIYLDIVKYIKSNSNKQLVIINPYCRYQIIKSDIKNFILGNGIYFLNSSNSVFLGGIYTEIAGIENIKGSKDIYNSFNFGIVTKVNFVKFNYNKIVPGF